MDSKCLWLICFRYGWAVMRVQAIWFLTLDYFHQKWDVQFYIYLKFFWFFWFDVLCFAEQRNKWSLPILHYFFKCPKRFSVLVITELKLNFILNHIENFLMFLSREMSVCIFSAKVESTVYGEYISGDKHWWEWKGASFPLNLNPKTSHTFCGKLSERDETYLESS